MFVMFVMFSVVSVFKFFGKVVYYGEVLVDSSVLQKALVLPGLF